MINLRATSVMRSVQLRVSLPRQLKGESRDDKMS